MSAAQLSAAPAKFAVTGYDLERLGQLLAQAHAIMLLIAADQNLEDIANNAGNAAASLISSAREMLNQIERTAP